MQIELPDKTADELKAMLARRGEDTDLEAYVQRTLSKRLLFETIGEVRERNRGVGPKELSEAIDEAVEQVRTSQSPSGADADCS